MSSKIKWGITEDAVEEAIRGVLDRAYAHDETIADEKYLPRTGGTLTGNLTLDPTTTTAPVLSLVNVESSGGEGPSRTTLRKNASSTADYGTILTDFAWGNGNTMQKQAQLHLWATSNPKYRLQLNYTGEDGFTTTSTIFGTHNPPGVADITGLSSALLAKADANHTHDYLPLSGGTLTGELTTQRNAPRFLLVSSEKEGVGRSRTVLMKNASASADSGTLLTDYVWGDGTLNNQRTALQIKSSEGQLRNRIKLIDYAEGGNYITYLLYGEHNKPGITDVSGLQDALDAIASTGGYDGILPVSHGGTGADNPLNAITALGGLSAASVGTPIANGDNIDEYRTPGTYVSSDGAISASLQGTPPWTNSGFKLYVIKSYTSSTFFQIATGTTPNGIVMRSKANTTSGWSNWVTISTSAHKHTIMDIAELQDELDNKAVVNHTHNYLLKTGGTITGNLTLDPENTNISRLTFISDEKEGVGSAMGVLYKNASNTQDNGIQLVDYVWGNGLINENKNVRLNLRAIASTKDALRLVFNDGDGTGTLKTYSIYGEHNKPWIDGQINLDETSDLNTITTIGWYRCPLSVTSQSIKHTPGYDSTTLVNTRFSIFNMTVGAIGPVSAPYIYQEILRMNDGKRWYRYTTNATAADPTWTEWVET